jgi:hypothetical protein
MRILRLAATLASVAALAACDSHFLDPDLAGVWGGTNIELIIQASRVDVTLMCDAKGQFPGDVRLSENSAFERDGKVTASASYRVRYDAHLAAYLIHPDTMMVAVYPKSPLVDPAPPLKVVRGQPGSFISLALCANPD